MTAANRKQPSRIFGSTMISPVSFGFARKLEGVAIL
jgi:hypothetical protein